MGTFLNFVAVAYNSSTALPFGTVVVILLILTLGDCTICLPGTSALFIWARDQSLSPMTAPRTNVRIPPHFYLFEKRFTFQSLLATQRVWLLNEFTPLLVAASDQDGRQPGILKTCLRYQERQAFLQNMRIEIFNPEGRLAPLCKIARASHHCCLLSLPFLLSKSELVNS
jgi:hypothetical protein